jgi:RNA polymerase sigma-70 factor (ECF subfamily)
MSGHEGDVLVGAATQIGRQAPSSDGSAAKLAELVHVHFDFVWRTLRRLGVSEAEDGAQQVFTIAWKKLAEIEAGKERAYLAGVAIRVAADHRRARSRRRETEAEPADLVAPESDPGELVDQRRARQVLGELLSALVPELQEAFVLFEIEQLTVREMAEVLGIPTGTVASRLRRAREAFQAELARRFPSATSEES